MATDLSRRSLLLGAASVAGAAVAPALPGSWAAGATMPLVPVRALPFYDIFIWHEDATGLMLRCVSPDGVVWVNDGPADEVLLIPRGEG